jgi:archaellum component FlaC
MKMKQNNQIPTEVVMNEKSMEILITKLVPTSQYFERSFEMLNGKIDDFKIEQREYHREYHGRFVQIDDRFNQIDKRFEQVDKRFNQIDKRFEQVDKRFNQIDKRFNQIDKRFEQVDNKIDEFKKDVDKRFEQVNENINNLALKIEQLTKAQEVTIRDYIIERDRHYDAKFNNLRMFNIATISLVAGVILKMMGIIQI